MIAGTGATLPLRPGRPATVGPMADAHRLLAYGTFGVVALVALASAWSWLTRRRSGGRSDHRSLVDRLALVAVGLVAGAGVLGLATITGGHGPSDPLHLLYGVAALLVLPVAMALGLRAEGRGRIRRRDPWIGLGAVVLLAVGLRLVMTG